MHSSKLNEHPGGTPNDNGGNERFNRTTKKEAGHVKCSTVNFIGGALKRLLETRSILDKGFGLMLSPVVNTRDLFMLALTYLPSGDPNDFTTRTYQLRKIEEDGTVYMPRHAAIHLAIKELKLQENKITIHEHEQIERYLFGSRGWWSKYQAMLDDPEAGYTTINNRCGRSSQKHKLYAFDEVNVLLGLFVRMKPIVHQENTNNSPPTGSYLEAMHQRFVNMGISNMNLQDLKNLGSEGLMSCNCEKWQHYMLCSHTFADAKQKGIVSIPITKDDRHSRRTGPSKGKGGRSKKIKQGRNAGLGFE